MSNKLKIIIAKISFFIPAASLLAALYAAEPIEIKAQKLTYEEDNNKIFAEVDVEITSGNFKMKGQKINIDLKKGYAIAQGSVTLQDKDSLLMGDRSVYDFNSSTGYVENAYGYFYPWGFNSEKTYRTKEMLNLEKSRLTTCILQNPHYYVSVKNAEIKPGEYIKGKKAVLKIHDIPVFYYPSFYYALKNTGNSMEIYPGYNTRDGIQIKTVFGRATSKYTYTKLYLDVLWEQGIGKGVEFNYNVPSKHKGTIYLYHIKEEKAQKERYTAKASHWQKLSKTWSLQGNMNYLSDEDFNRYYFTESWNRLNRQSKSDISFTKQTSKTNLQISFDKTDVFDLASNGFVTDNYTLPRVNFTIFTIRPKYLPFYYGFNTTLYRTYTRVLATTTWNSSSDLFIMRQFPVSIRTTITPKAGIIENWYELNGQNDFWTNKYTELSVRQRINWFTHIDLIHYYKNRTKINSSDIDEPAIDYGIENNSLRGIFYISQKSNQYFRMSTNYDLREYRNYTFRNNISRVSALVSEVGTPINRYLNVYVNHQYNIEYSTTVSFQTELKFTPNGKTNLSFGYYYIETSTTGVQLRSSVSFWPTNKWQLILSVMGMFGRETKIMEQSVKVYRDLHCWETSATYNKIGEVEEYFFNIGMKISAPKPEKQVYNPEHEKEFYPWR